MEKLNIIIDDNELGRLEGDEIDEVVGNYQENSGETYDKDTKSEK